MGMSVGGGGEDEPMMEMNMTPLIDVMLVLLVMFIITIPVMTHAVKLDMPRADERAVAGPAGDHQPRDRFRRHRPLERHAGAGFDTLDAYFRRESANDPQPELHIRPSKRADYDVVARVLASAQRNRMLKIGFVGNEQFM